MSVVGKSWLYYCKKSARLCLHFIFTEALVLIQGFVILLNYFCHEFLLSLLPVVSSGCPEHKTNKTSGGSTLHQLVLALRNSAIVAWISVQWTLNRYFYVRAPRIWAWKTYLEPFQSSVLQLKRERFWKCTRKFIYIRLKIIKPFL